MFCPMCGAPNEEDAAYCGNCGAALTEEARAAEALEKRAEELVADVQEGIESAQEQVAEAVEALPPPPPAPRPAQSYSATPASVPTSGMAIASLVLGIGGLTVLPFLGSIAAVILGYMARSDIRKRPDEVSGDGMALAGIVLGWIAIGLVVLGIGGVTVCGICGFISSGPSSW